ncbi:MAG: PAS domain S-box protein, partial [Calditrichia bacterium]|nr:PAS domain S-box protein [Calditrichia bacterium]
AYCESLGYTREDMIGINVDTLAHPENIKQIDENIRRLLSDEMLHHVVKTIRKDGSECFMDLKERKINLPDGREGIICVAEDITERRNLEEQFRQAQKMDAIGQLAGGVAHDFNNLLTVIQGYSQLIMMRLDENDPIYKTIKEIDLAVSRAEALTRQLLAFSRKQILQPKVISINEIIINMEKMLRRLIKENIELITLLGPETGSIKADPGQIEQVIMNLIVNARDAMPDGGKLTIETSTIIVKDLFYWENVTIEPNTYIVLTVSDTGSGMDKEVMAHIFEPFFTTKGEGKGTGLGLSTVYGIVKQSGGYVDVESELGKGATFKISFPFVEEIAEKVEKVESSKEPLKGSETILVVEDEDLLRNLACQTLRLH